jgi:uncharacterized protein YkwD
MDKRTKLSALDSRTVLPMSPRSSRATGARRLVALGVLLVAVLGSTVALSTPASAATVRQTKTEQRISAAVAKLLNAERKAHHLKALHVNAKLRLSARRHNLTMAKHNTMSHQLPGEAFFARRISKAGYHWTWAGENIGWNSRMTKAGVLALEKFMYNERPPNDGHRVNILSRHYRDVGIDVYIDHKHHKVWLTTDFGRH